jgi:hypothetical protein
MNVGMDIIPGQVTSPFCYFTPSHIQHQHHGHTNEAGRVLKFCVIIILCKTLGATTEFNEISLLKLIYTKH